VKDFASGRSWILQKIDISALRTVVKFALDHLPPLG
jgi:hypothetical protein